MTDLSVKYLGLELKSPVIASASPLTASADKVAVLEEHGVGAVVLKSVFEEQIEGHSASLERYGEYYPEAGDYLRHYVGSDYVGGYLDMIRECKRRVHIPLIASINCSTGGGWVDYARRIADAGADALELNIFILPTDAAVTAPQVEDQYLAVVEKVVKSAPGLPVSVKLGMRFTNILSVAQGIYYRGGRGVVMYNRFFEPDIDIDNLTLAGADFLSTSSELRNALRPVALCSAVLPELDIAVSTGVHSGADAVKAMLAGAEAVQVCSTLYVNGLDAIGGINSFIGKWMKTHQFESIADFRGLMNYKGAADAQLYQRVQFMRFFPND